MGKPTTFDSSCNVAQQKLIGFVLERAKRMVDRAVFRTSLLDADRADQVYVDWFGAFDESRAHYVRRTYKLISRALERGIECACDDNGGNYAKVFPGLKRKIHFQPTFWKAPYSGLNSKPGTIVHELSHEVLRGGDIAYGIDNAKRLAAVLPWIAVRNADNYEYFAESL